MDEATVKIYDEHASEFSQKYSNVDMIAVHELLLRYLPHSGQILEIGCGSGRDALFLAKNGFSVTATDASCKMLEQGMSEHLTCRASGKLQFSKAAFPLQSYDKLLQEKFSSVVAIGVVMHIPDQDLFEFAFQIRKLLQNGGTLFLSVSHNRSGLDTDNRDGDGRLFIERPVSELRLLFERLGFRFVALHESADSLQRDDIRWLSMVFIMESAVGDRPVDQIEIIINRDRKSATYKLALLRALCEISQTSYNHVRWHPDETVSLPLWLVAEKWLYYYWPLMEAGIAQIRGEGKKKPEAFRKDLQKLIEFYKRKGGLNAFHASYQNRTLSELENKLVNTTLKRIADTIVTGPIKYSSQGDFSYVRGRQRRGSPHTDELLHTMGFINFRADVWREMCLLGHWISEAIILRWAELTFDITQRQVPISVVLEKLLEGPEQGRQINAVKDLFKKLPGLRCVWTDYPLKATRFDVDHMIPFSLWHNNELWNLVPTQSKINNQKRDKLVSREALLQSQERIVFYWQHQRMAMNERFDREITQSLLGRNRPDRNWEKSAFTALKEAVETLALQRGIERWSPIL